MASVASILRNISALPLKASEGWAELRQTTYSTSMPIPTVIGKPTAKNIELRRRPRHNTDRQIHDQQRFTTTGIDSLNPSRKICPPHSTRVFQPAAAQRQLLHGSNLKLSANIWIISKCASVASSTNKVSNEVSCPPQAPVCHAVVEKHGKAQAHLQAGKMTSHFDSSKNKTQRNPLQHNQELIDQHQQAGCPGSTAGAQAKRLHQNSKGNAHADFDAGSNSTITKEGVCRHYPMMRTNGQIYALSSACHWAVDRNHAT